MSIIDIHDQEPNNGGSGGNEDCVILRPDGKWYDKDCAIADMYYPMCGKRKCHGRVGERNEEEE